MAAPPEKIDSINALVHRIENMSRANKADLSLRMALRMLPLVFDVFDLPNEVFTDWKKKQFVIDSFRGAQVAWVLRKAIEQQTIVSVKTSNVLAAALSDEARKRKDRVVIFRAKAASYAGAAITYSASNDPLPNVANAVSSAASAASEVIKSQQRNSSHESGATTANDYLPLELSWQAIEADVFRLEHNTYERLLDQPLWLNELQSLDGAYESILSWVNDLLGRFESESRVTEGPWGLILEWYRALLPDDPNEKPHSAFGEEADLEIATKDEAFWDRDPDEVMADIAGIVGWQPQGRSSQEKKTKSQAKKNKTSKTEQQSAQQKSSPPKSDAESSGETSGQSSDAVETHSDEPTADDQLGRRPFARAVVERMDDVRRKGGRDGFAVHLHAPWGAGKTSVLMMMDEIMTDAERDPTDRWAVVHFNAWRHERRKPPWWPLLETLKKDCAERLRRRGHTKPALILRLKWQLWKIWADWIPFLLAAAVLFAGLFIAWRYLWPSSTDGLSAVVKTVLGVLASGAAAFGAFVVAGRALVFGSTHNAKFYFDLSRDPLKHITHLFNRMVATVNVPICIFIDDLDRCHTDYVVDLLEGIQTSFRHEKVAYVIAADRAWIRTSFRDRYEKFSENVGDAGQPLGYLFLEKIFQVSTPIPGMSKTKREEYWKGLLQQGADSPPADRIKMKKTPAEEKRVSRVKFDRDVRNRRSELVNQHKKSLTHETANANLTEESSAVERAAWMLAVNASRTAEAASEHLLAQFANVLPDNPRVMKRMVNAFGLRQGIGILEGNKVSSRVLARWTILEQRYPALADFLIDYPEWTDKLAANAAKHNGDGIPIELQPLASSNVIGQIIGEASDNQSLTTDHVREITRGSSS